jgi:V/A-type H+-transporting ATPase subunit E
MGLEDVKQDILEEAETEAEEIISEAEQEKKRILEEANEEAEKIREETDEEIEEKKEALEKKAVSNANMEAKKKKLEAKEDGIEEAFESFRETLEQLDEDERESFVENAVEDAGFEVGEILASGDYQDLTDHESSSLEEEGFILVSEDGQRRLNFTLDKIVSDFREEYRSEVAEKLFN